MKEQIPSLRMESSPKPPDVLGRNLDKKTGEIFEKFLDKAPEGLENDGVKNRLLVLGLQMKLAKNLLNEEEQEKFDKMFRGIPKVEGMDTAKVEKRYFENLVASRVARIPIPNFEGYPGNEEKMKQKFIAKLRSLGFDVSIDYARRPGGPDKEYVLILSFLEEFDDKFYIKTGI